MSNLLFSVFNEVFHSTGIFPFLVRRLTDQQMTFP